ncbi:hypothetical protein MJ560_13565 [Klebsiella pneumoniae]|nr:hypothetical protein MJ560_13565 [Klebsiella pneumoniae]
MVETEAWHYLAVRISRGEIHLSLRDLSSQPVVEDQLELALTDSTPFLTRVIDHIDRFFIRHQKKLERLTSIASDDARYYRYRKWHYSSHAVL